MPTNIGSQNVRVSLGLLNAGHGDDFPGGGSVTPGLAPAQLGQRVRLGANEVKYSTAVGTLYEGTFQYVQTLSTDSIVPDVGVLAFWSNRATYLVTTVDTLGANLAGVFINQVTPGKYWFIQAIEGGRGNVFFADTPALGEICSPLQNGTAQAEATATAAVNAAQLAVRFGKALGAKTGNLALVAYDQQQS